METVFASPEFGIAGAWLAEYTLTGLEAGVAVFDVDGKVAQWNRTAAHLLGVPEEVLAGRHLDDPALALTGAHGRPLTPADDPVRRALSTAEPVRAVTLGVAGGADTLRWRRIDVLPVFGVDRSPRAALATVVEGAPCGLDANPPWRMAARALLDCDLTATLVIDARGHVVDWNRRSLDLFGRDPTDLTGRHLTEVCDIDLEWVHTRLAAEGGRAVGGTTWALHRDGHELAVVARFTAVDWPDVGRAVVAHLLDTAICAEVAGAAPQADARVFAYAHVPMLVVSHAGDVLGANRASLSLLDAHIVDLVGRPLTQCLAGLDPAALNRAIAEADLTTSTTLGTYLVRSRAEPLVTTTITALGPPERTAARTFLVQLTTSVPASPAGTRLQPEL